MKPARWCWWCFMRPRLALFVVIAFTCVRFRRMRVITWMEAVRVRYGPFTEQFYTWIKLPLLLFFAGVGLNAIGVFMSAVFHLPMNTMLVDSGRGGDAGGVCGRLVGGAGERFCAGVSGDDDHALHGGHGAGPAGNRRVERLVPEGAVASQFHWTELARPELILHLGRWRTCGSNFPTRTTWNGPRCI